MKMSSYPEDPLRRSDQPVHPLERHPVPESQGPIPPQPVYPSRRLDLPQSNPVFTYILIGLNVLVFIADIAMQGTLRELGAKDNLWIVQGEYWRFITPMFLHAGALHLLLNCYSIYNVGPSVERAFGYFRF